MDLRILCACCILQQGGFHEQAACRHNHLHKGGLTYETANNQGTPEEGGNR